MLPECNQVGISTRYISPLTGATRVLHYGWLNHAVTRGARATVHCQKPSATHHASRGWEPQASDISKTKEYTNIYYIEEGRQHQAASYNEHVNTTASFE